jgi:hypothetical protein
LVLGVESEYGNTKMDEVVGFISESLPNLSPELLERVKEKFIDLGVYDVDDIKLIQEQDVSDVLRPIQIRKLMQRCSAGLFLLCYCRSYMQKYNAACIIIFYQLMNKYSTS